MSDSSDMYSKSVPVSASLSLPISFGHNVTDPGPCAQADDQVGDVDDNMESFSFEGELFEVTLRRNSLGLGLSITGGPDAPYPFTNLIRVKKIFPLQPAWETGQLQEGDILLSAGGKSLTGMTLRQALDVLRCSPPLTTLCISRPNETDLEAVESAPKTTATSTGNKRIRSYSFSPASIQRSLSIFTDDLTETMEVEEEDADGNKVFSNANDNNRDNQQFGEFTVTLNKVNGSLGFSLRSDPDDTVTALRHSVRALVREPAISDGRIRPGDKLIQANGKDLGPLSHKDLIAFLRSLPHENVVLTFYRDASRAQTPVSTPTAESSSRSHPNLAFLASQSFSISGSSVTSTGKQLRHEAKEMVNHWGFHLLSPQFHEFFVQVRSLQASRTSLDGGSRSGSTASRRGLSRPFSPSPNR